MCKKVRGYVGMYADLKDADDRLAFMAALKELEEAGLSRHRCAAEADAP
jgi:hypothetical protein